MHAQRFVVGGDYNGDGRSDILQRNDNGRLYLWQMNGNAITDGGEVGVLTPESKIVDGVGTTAETARTT